MLSAHGTSPFLLMAQYRPPSVVAAEYPIALHSRKATCCSIGCRPTAAGYATPLIIVDACAGTLNAGSLLPTTAPSWQTPSGENEARPTRTSRQGKICWQVTSANAIEFWFRTCVRRFGVFVGGESSNTVGRTKAAALSPRGSSRQEGRDRPKMKADGIDSAAWPLLTCSTGWTSIRQRSWVLIILDYATKRCGGCQM
jgi:hypothetical protein